MGNRQNSTKGRQGNFVGSLEKDNKDEQKWNLILDSLLGSLGDYRKCYGVGL